MRALAEFVMQGRAQASFAAAIGSFVPLVSSAVVALVILRRGLSDGLVVFLWGLLPALLLVGLYGKQGSAVFLLSVAPVLTLVAATLGAVVLRLAVSWENTLIVMAVIGAIGALVLQALLGDRLDQVEEAVQEMLQQINQQRERQGLDVATTPLSDKVFLLGAIAYSCALNAVMGLAIARWWQAVLYNPGGFQAEFHSIRLSIVQALAVFPLVVYGLIIEDFSGSWGYIAALPLIIAGISLIHWLVKQSQLGTVWLVLFYFALVVMPPIVLLTISLALLDSVIDCRGRLQSINKDD